MPRQQTFDGPELDTVLSRVRREVGAEAKIISASKFRKGGVGGFFSKESFRVTVELPGDGPVADPPHEPLPFEPTTLGRDEQVTPPPSTLLELADLVDEAEAEAGAVSLEAAQCTPASDAALPMAKAAATSLGTPVVPAVREARYVPTTERPSFNAVLRRLTSEADAGDDRRSKRPEVVRAPAVIPHPVARTGVRLPKMPVAGSEIDTLVSALGIPESLLPTDLSPAAAVVAMLHSLRLPEPPTLPTDPGAVTVIVGERRAATELAHDLASELGLKRSDVKVADPASKAKTGLHDPAQVADLRAGWGRHPKLVAVAAPLARTGLTWAWATLAALEADALWGVVGADRKCEDVEAWSAALGGFDALAINDLEQTVSPAALLELGIPVARLDGQPATPAAWAALLTARLAA